MSLFKKLKKKVAKATVVVSGAANVAHKVANNPVVQGLAPIALGPAGSQVLSDVDKYSMQVSTVSKQINAALSEEKGPGIIAVPEVPSMVDWYGAVPSLTKPAAPATRKPTENKKTEKSGGLFDLLFFWL